MKLFHGEYKIPGGKLVQVDLGVADQRLVKVQISGDFFLEPPETIERINAALEGLPADSDEATTAGRVDAVLAADNVAVFGLSAAGVAVALTRALQGGAST